MQNVAERVTVPDRDGPGQRGAEGSRRLLRAQVNAKLNQILISEDQCQSVVPL